MYKIVLDTNILISSLISKKGSPYLLYQGWWQKLFTLVTSEEQLGELERVLQHPKLQKFIVKSEAATMLNGLYDFAFIAREIPEVNYSPDLDDNLIIGTAIAGEANFIVTGDKQDLLKLKSVQDISIVTAVDAVSIVDIKV